MLSGIGITISMALYSSSPMPDVVTSMFIGLAPSGVAEYTGMPANVVSSTRSPPRAIEASVAAPRFIPRPVISTPSRMYFV